MKVTLIAHTPEPERVCTMSAKTCYSPKHPDDIYGEYRGNNKVLNDVIDSGHLSVLEHVTFTFAVSGVSRVLTHQLVRHRLASYEQESLRYVTMKDISVHIPESVKNNESARQIFEDTIRHCGESYRKLIEQGISAEDSRYLIPDGILTNIVITMNARQLRHYFSLRCCNRTQDEHRELANLMLRKCKEVSPVIFKDCGPACVNGICPEGKRACGHPRVDLRDGN